MSPTPVLSVESVHVAFGGVHAVDDVSLVADEGSRWAVIGPNGAGKTTLFRAIAGEVSPTSGRVNLLGEDVTEMAPHRRVHRGLGRTYQVTNLFPALTVEENLAIAAIGTNPRRFRSWFPLRMGADTGGRVVDVLERVQLIDKREHRVDELSHGEQRQLELAMGLAAQPKLLLLDEPAAGLSAAERGLMRQLIESLPSDLTVILIEHDMGLALDLVQHVMVLDNGAVLASGSPTDIRENEDVQAVYLKVD
ncbi:MAG: ATP-binding cassette domain-containing protein [Acidimicrobiia bacterium]|nr:ATP-binding cassette domain-containing protein [Acidimicrobiia bacterium]